MIDGIIHALASYERVERRREVESIDDRESFKELGMTLSPELKAALSQPLSDGRALVDHILEAQALFRDLDSIGKAS
jgi:hypothetical protein